MILTVTTILTSCSSVTLKQIGSINMISTRNVSLNSNYALVSSFTNSSDKELKKSEAKYIEEAINELVKKTPGGEFLMNVKLYSVKTKKNTYYAVSGDVWGNAGNISFKGFKVGDKVIYKKMFASKYAIISALKDDKTCYIKYEEKDKLFEVDYNDLTRTE